MFNLIVRLAIFNLTEISKMFNLAKRSKMINLTDSQICRMLFNRARWDAGRSGDFGMSISAQASAVNCCEALGNTLEGPIAKAGIAPDGAAMFDDIARNLVPAHALGMTTVWLNTDAAWARQGPEFPVASAQHIDHETKDHTHFLNSIRI